MNKRSEKQNDTRSAIANRKLGDTMYNGEPLPKELFDSLNPRPPSYSPQKDADVQKLQGTVSQLIQRNAELIEGVSGSIAPRDGGLFEFGASEIYLERGIGLHWPDNLTHELFEEFGKALFALHDDAQLWVGEYALKALEAFRVGYDKTAVQFGYQPETIREYVWVCNTVPKSARASNLSYSHYRMVAAKKYNKERVELLHKASMENMTISQFWDHLRTEAKTDPPTPFDAYLSHWSREKKELRGFLSRVGDKEEQRLIIKNQREYLDQLEKEFGL